MPLLSGNYHPSAGPLINVAIVQPQLTASVQPFSPLGADIKMYMALIDTGASCTCITKKVVADVGLAPIGRAPMSGSTGAVDVDQYVFGVGFVFGARQEATGMISGNMSLIQVHGCEFTDHGFGFDVLLGRDIICKGSFTLSFDGHWVLAL